MLYRWMSVHPDFNRFSGWEIEVVTDATAMAARSWWRSGFPVKITCIEDGKAVKNISEIRSGKSYRIKGVFLNWKDKQSRISSNKPDRKYKRYLLKRQKEKLENARLDQMRKIIEEFKIVLGPLRYEDITVEKIRGLFRTNERDIYELVDKYRRARIRQAVLEGDIRAYIALTKGNSPAYLLCHMINFCIREALDDIGMSCKLVPVPVDGRVVHIYSVLLLDEGDIAIDAAFPGLDTEGMMPIEVDLDNNYKDKVGKAARDTFSLENRLLFTRKRKEFRKEFRRIREKEEFLLLVESGVGDFHDLSDYLEKKTSPNTDI